MFTARLVLVSTLVVIGLMFTPAYSQGNTLLLQQSPFEGGVVTPSPGIYLFDPDTEVTLVATAKPGYQFVCWLGDVGDATSNRTNTFLNQPKVIVAVFERCQYEDVYGGGSGSNPIASSAGISGGGGISSGGSVGGGGSTPTPTPDPTPDPVPDPDPVPEPMTILLLGTGGLMLLRKRSA